MGVLALVLKTALSLFEPARKPKLNFNFHKFSKHSVTYHSYNLYT